jgi:DNA-binding transcriptional LysR family regulator
LSDSILVARKIGGFRQLLVATPSWAEGHRTLRPSDLSDQPFVANGALREPVEWQFTRGDFERLSVRMTSVLSIHTTPAVLAATLAGGGASVLPDFLAEHLRTGELVNLLPEWSLPAGGIFVVYPALRFRPPKVRAFTSMLTERNSL